MAKMKSAKTVQKTLATRIMSAPITHKNGNHKKVKVDKYDIDDNPTGEKMQVLCQPTIGYLFSNGQEIMFDGLDMSSKSDQIDFLRKIIDFNDICQLGSMIGMSNNRKNNQKYLIETRDEDLFIHLTNNPISKQKNFFVRNTATSCQKMDSFLLLFDIDNKDESTSTKNDCLETANRINQKYFGGFGVIEDSSSGNGIHLYFFAKNTIYTRSNYLWRLSKTIRLDTSCKVGTAFPDRIMGIPTIMDWSSKPYRIVKRGNVLKLPRIHSLESFITCRNNPINIYDLLSKHSLLRHPSPSKQSLFPYHPPSYNNNRDNPPESLTLHEIGQIENYKKRRMAFIRHEFKNGHLTIKDNFVERYYQLIGKTRDEKGEADCRQVFDGFEPSKCGILKRNIQKPELPESVKMLASNFKHKNYRVQLDVLAGLIQTIQSLVRPDGTIDLGMHSYCTVALGMSQDKHRAFSAIQKCLTGKTTTKPKQHEALRKKYAACVKFLESIGCLTLVSDAIREAKCRTFKFDPSKLG